MYAGLARVSSPARPDAHGGAGAGGRAGQPGVFASRPASWAQINFLPRPSSLYMPTLDLSPFITTLLPLPLGPWAPIWVLSTLTGWQCRS